jgi:hypothetical protein
MSSETYVIEVSLPEAAKLIPCSVDGLRDVAQSNRLPHLIRKEGWMWRVRVDEAALEELRELTFRPVKAR